MNLIEAWFDGVCEPRNPGGHAAWGAAVNVAGQPAYRDGGYVGCGDGMSNNVAEYMGALKAMEAAAKHAGPIILRGDSKLVINQLAGHWKVNGGYYLPYYQRAWTKLREIGLERIGLIWIPREQNEICDVLSKQVLRDRGITFRIQPEGKR